MTITFTNNAYKSTNWGVPSQQVLSTKGPQNWKEVYVQTLLKELPEELTDELNPEAVTEEKLTEGINDVTSLKSNRDRIISALHIVFGVLLGVVEDKRINFDGKNQGERQALAFKIYEGIVKCSEGFEDRLNETIIGFYRPKNMAEYAESFRFDIMKRVAQAITSEVHGQNYVSQLALSVNFGSKVINDEDDQPPQDRDFPNDEEVLTRLSAALEGSYSPLNFLHYLEHKLRMDCTIIGYTGPAEAYAFPEYDAMEKAIKCIIPNITAMEIFVGELAKYDADDPTSESYLAKVKDINWPIIRKKMIEAITAENLFSNPNKIINPIELIPESYEELEYWISCEPTNDQLHIWLFTDNDYQLALCYLLCILPVTHAVIEEQLKNNKSDGFFEDFIAALKEEESLFKKQGLISKLITIFKNHMTVAQAEASLKEVFSIMLFHADSGAFQEILDYCHENIASESMRKLLKTYSNNKELWKSVLKSGNKALAIMRLMEEANIRLHYDRIAQLQKRLLDENDMYNKQEIFIVAAHIDVQCNSNEAVEIFNEYCEDDEDNSKLFSLIRKCKLNSDTKNILENALKERPIQTYFQRITPANVDQYLDLLTFVVHMDDEDYRQKIVDNIKLELCSDADCLLGILKVLSEANVHPRKFTSLAQRNISRVLGPKINIVCEQNYLPHKVRLSLLEDPNQIVAELARHNEYRYMDYNKVEIKRFERFLKREHWYQIAKQGLLPDKLVKKHKEEVLEYINQEDDGEKQKDIKNALEATNSHFYHFFRIQRGWRATHESRGTLQKLAKMQESAADEAAEQNSCICNILRGIG